jgi:hypothetical protein
MFDFSITLSHASCVKFALSLGFAVFMVAIVMPAKMEEPVMMLLIRKSSQHATFDGESLHKIFFPSAAYSSNLVGV